MAEQIKSGNHGKIDLNYDNDYLQNIMDLSLKVNNKERPNIDKICELMSVSLTV